MSFTLDLTRRPELTRLDLKNAANASRSLDIPVHVIVTDMNQIVRYVNESFETFTGFSKEEVVGRKCNFLQGEETDPRDVMDMRLAIQSLRETSVVILNYTKSGSAFWNTLRIRPLFGEKMLNRPMSSFDPVSGFVGEIFSLPVPDELRKNRPRMCLDDALALMRVAATIPRFTPTSKQLLDGYDTSTSDSESETSMVEDEEVPTTPSSTPSFSPVPLTASPTNSKLQRHVNYSTRLSKKSTSPPTSPSRSEEPTFQIEEAVPKFEFVAETLLPTHHGRFRVRAYRDSVSGAEPLAMIVGNVEDSANVLCRVHDQCQTSEVFGSLRCDCKEQLDSALIRIQREGGMVLYLPQEGRGIGLANKVAAYAAQEMGLDTVDANRHLGLPDDAREYFAVRDILDDLRITSIRLMTNNPRKITELVALGVEVSERVSHVTPPNSNFSLAYVKAKKERMFHMFEDDAWSSPGDVGIVEGAVAAEAVKRPVSR